MNSVLSFRRVRWVVSNRQVIPTVVFAAQQVADLLRDKLHTMGTELAEARARILELEELTTADRNRSESTALKIHQSGKRVSPLPRRER